MSTSEKTISSSMQHIELQLADKNPALLQAFRLYHELDQVAYDLGLIDMDESLANKTSWSPVITVIGDLTSGSSEFINRYLKTALPVIDTKNVSALFTVLIHREGETPMTLPGTAVNGDSRLPFYHIGERLEQLKKGESRNINNYLELKTNNSQNLKDKTIILAPGFSSPIKPNEVSLLREHAIDLSDQVFVFFDASKANLDSSLATLIPFLKTAEKSNNPGKFIYVINQAAGNPVAVNLDNWKQQLNEAGLQSGQFFTINQASKTTDQQILEQKLANIDVESSYRILNTLEQHITELDTITIREVTKATVLWKDRTHFTLVILLSFIALTLVAGEIQMGLVAFLLDPFIASIFFFLLLVFLIPFHLYSSKIHAKFIRTQLAGRQTELGLIENLPALFDKGLTFWRIMLPIVEPIGWTDEVKGILKMIKTRAQDLVQSLNNSFNSSALKQGAKEETFLDL